MIIEDIIKVRTRMELSEGVIPTKLELTQEMYHRLRRDLRKSNTHHAAYLTLIENWTVYGMRVSIKDKSELQGHQMVIS